MNSIMSLSDTRVVAEAMKHFRNALFPKITDSLEEKQKNAAEVRVKLAEYFYEDVKKRLQKGKRITEEEMNLRKKDVEDSKKAYMSLGR